MLSITRASSLPSKLAPIASASLALLLGACGSGGGASPASLQVTGVASTGAALKGALIEVKCANGTEGQKVSNDSGIFTVDVAGGQLPCVLRATGTDESGNDITLHSVADATPKANITPLTQVIVAAAGGANSKTPEEIFANFASDTTSRSAVSTGQLAFAQTVVVAAVKATAPTVDLANINPMTADFTVGNSNDQKIDTFIAALKANASTASTDAVVSTLAQAVKTATQANQGDASAAATAASSSAQTVVSTPFPIPSCPAIQRVPHRIVGMGGGNGLTNVPLINGAGTSAALTTRWDDGSTESSTMTFNPTASCKFSLAAGSSTLTGAFARSGLFVVQDPGSVNSTAGIGIGFPEQTIPLSELAGVWNALEYSVENNAWMNQQSTVTIDKNGAIVKSFDCSLSASDYSSCTDAGAVSTPSLTTNAINGGFDVKDGNVTRRAFAYRAPSGDLLLAVQTPGSRGLLIGAKQKAYPSPVLNAEVPIYSVKAFGTSTITTSFTSLTFKASAYTASSVNSTGAVSSPGTVTWLRTLLNGSADNWTVTDLIDQPRFGMNYRPAVQYTAPGANSASRTPAALQLHTGNAGLTVSVGIPGSNAAAGWSSGTLPSETFLQFTVRSK